MEEVKSLLQTSSKTVAQYYVDVLHRFADKDGFLDADVTDDGSWYTRGHKSLLGVGIVVNAYFEIMSEFCVMCIQMKTGVKKKIMTQQAFEK